MSRLTDKRLAEASKKSYFIAINQGRRTPKITFERLYQTLAEYENLMEKYEIEDLVELEIALDQYYHRYDNIQTRRVDSNE